MPGLFPHLDVQTAVIQVGKLCHHFARSPVTGRRLRHALAGILILVVLSQGAAAHAAPAVRKILVRFQRSMMAMANGKTSTAIAGLITVTCEIVSGLA